MTKKEVIKILLNEQRCVKRASNDACDRECGHCDLILEDCQILEAYQIAIEALIDSEKNDGWIKISNGDTPELSGTYAVIVNIPDYDNDAASWIDVIGLTHFSGNKFGTVLLTGGGYVSPSHIVAWKPLTMPEL